MEKDERYQYLNALIEAGKLKNFTDNEVRIQKIISRFNEKLKSWERVGETTVLKLGEKIRITITIESPKPLLYVFINDQKAPAFEPAVYQSGYN